MPYCPDCGAQALSADRDDWWVCPRDDEDCNVMAFLDADAPETEDPRNPQQTLPDGGRRFRRADIRAQQRVDRPLDERTHAADEPGHHASGELPDSFTAFVGGER